MDSVNVDRVLLCRVSPFGNLRIKAHLRLPEAYRSLSRPSSALSAKAFPLRPLQLDLLWSDSSMSRNSIFLSCSRHTSSPSSSIHKVLHSSASSSVENIPQNLFVPLHFRILCGAFSHYSAILQELGKISVLVISCEITEFNKNPTRFYLANFVVDLLINLPNNKTSKPFC